MGKNRRSRKSQAHPQRAPSTADLIAQCRQGVPTAEREIFERYLGRLTALARARLASQLAARFGASDVVMSAYRSFFIGLRQERFVIDDERDLWPLLVQITLHKLYRNVERHQTRKRAVGREVAVQRPRGLEIMVPDHAPGPAEAAAVADELEHLLSELPPLAQRIVELRLSGEQIVEIAAEVQVNERTVRRWLARAGEILENRNASPDAGDGKKGKHRIKASISPTGLTGQTAADVKGTQPSSRVLAANPIETDFPQSLPKLDYADYVLQKLIGAGASGKVYRALCRRDGKLYALKFLRKQAMANRTAVDRFVREYEIVAKLNHPHVMPVLGCGRTSVGSYFFAMHLARGDLQHQIGKRISQAQAQSWIVQAAEGVLFAHKHSVIHCDLKPSNLLALADGQIVVSDFDLARQASHVAVATALAGTPSFMAPEQVTDSWGNISPRTDVYGLGATLYALLTGRPPYVGRRPADVFAAIIAREPAISPLEFRPRLSADLAHICLRCLEKCPDDRFASMEELRDALVSCRA